MKTKRSVSCFVMVVCMLFIATQVNAESWDINDDLVANPDPNLWYWPTEGGPVVGPWSMGWAWVDTPWNVSLFNTYMNWGNNVWITDDDSWTYPADPAYHCMPHGGVLLGGVPIEEPQLGMCLIVPSAVLRNQDPNDYLQYTALVWTSPVADPEMNVKGLFNPPYGGDVCDYFILKLEPETLDPNYFIDNPGEDPNDYMEMLYTKSNPTYPTEADVFSLTTSVDPNSRLLFAVKRNAYTATPASCWPTLDVTIGLQTCQQQNEFMKADLNQDCFVNLADLALLASDWLICNDPEGPGCTPPVIPSVLRVDFNGYYNLTEPYTSEFTPDNAYWTYDGPGLLGSGTFWNGAEIANFAMVISDVYPGPGYLLDDGVTDAQVTVALSAIHFFGDNESIWGDTHKMYCDYIDSDYRFAGTEPNSVYIDITISGLIPGNSYTLAGYGSHVSNILGIGGVWMANGAGPLNLSMNVANTGIIENVIADVDGKILIHVDNDTFYAPPTYPGEYVVVNGFELQGTFNAEPVRTCQSNGIYEDRDINLDCYVNLGDFAMISQKWLECNDPQDETCTATAP